MKRYKAIFDLPDNIIPPNLVGFQIPIVETNVNGTQVIPHTFTAPLLPMAYFEVEDGVYVEAVEKEEVCSNVSTADNEKWFGKMTSALKTAVTKEKE